MSRRVGFVTHPDCARHNCAVHTEHAGRTEAIERHFQETGLIDQLIPLPAREATIEELALNHDPGYIDEIRTMNPACVQLIDNDTYITPDSWHAALLSYGGAILAVEKVIRGELDRAFCCLRPPGHHAEYHRAMGFCLFNNIAGAARYARQSCGIERVAIVDFDVHHGNGTQYSFYSDSSVHFTSIHQWPLFPGTGSANEKGISDGSGFTWNIPLSPGTTGAAALALFEPGFRRAMESFRPQLVMVSAGFDAHREDPLAQLRFEDEDYLAFTLLLSEIADRLAEGRIVSVLEGGYNLAALSRSAAQHVKGLLADD
jgi:acetoin utilization deacetylase AcuC-like enzyme